MPFIKGHPGGPGRPKGRSPDQLVRFDLKQAARAYCPEAIEIIARCMRSDDERVAVMAANIMLERGYGKPEQRADVDVNHRFVVAPQVMPLDRWLANKGQPDPEPPADLTPPVGEKLNSLSKASHKVIS
jgi:hypothetical protein